MNGIKYPVNPNLAQYQDVMICRECACMPGGHKRKSAYQFTKPILQALAKSYNPVGLYCAPINRDHDGIWYGGPAEGIVAAVRYEEVDGKGVLLADLANIPEWIAEQIDGHQWPTRSIEWIDAPDLFSWYQEIEYPIPIERLRFYGTEDYYLTGLGLLGQFEPAVPGLGPVPPRVVPDDQDSSDRETLEVIILPAAAAQFEQHRYAAYQIHRLEADMTGAANAQEKPRVTGLPPANTAAQPPGAPATSPEGDTVESLRAQLAEVSAERDALAAGKAKPEAQDTDPEKAEMRARLELIEEERRSEKAEARILQLQAKGQLLPADTPIYRQLAGLLLGAESITLAGGRVHSMAAAGEDAQADPLALVDQLLAKRSHPQGGEVAPDASDKRDHARSAAGAKQHLDDGDMQVLAGLRASGRDFSDSEYLEYLNSGNLPARFTGKSQGESS